jgi:hypothetical protein
MTDEAMSPLRRRMIEDMTIRKLAPKTQQGYIRIANNADVVSACPSSYALGQFAMLFSGGSGSPVGLS